MVLTSGITITRVCTVCWNNSFDNGCFNCTAPSDPSVYRPEYPILEIEGYGFIDIDAVKERYIKELTK